ncbi:MAG: hypothetical protein M3M89_04550, partial [Thermoproteota archaeon]|nr:hypothetical protein [Thermoproteota archaeon]
TEQAYLADKEQFSKPQQRYIRYRINKKLKVLDRDAAAELRDAFMRRPRGLSTAFIKTSPSLPINAPKLALGSMSLGNFSS